MGKAVSVMNELGIKKETVVDWTKKLANSEDQNESQALCDSLLDPNGKHASKTLEDLINENMEEVSSQSSSSQVQSEKPSSTSDDTKKELKTSSPKPKKKLNKKKPSSDLSGICQDLLQDEELISSFQSMIQNPAFRQKFSSLVTKNKTHSSDSQSSSSSSVLPS